MSNKQNIIKVHTFRDIEIMEFLKTHGPAQTETVSKQFEGLYHKTYSNLNKLVCKNLIRMVPRSFPRMYELKADFTYKKLDGRTWEITLSPSVKASTE